MPRSSKWTKKGRALREERKRSQRLANLLHQLDDFEDSTPQEEMPRNFDSVVHHIVDMESDSNKRIRTLMGYPPVQWLAGRHPRYRQFQKAVRKARRKR